MDPHLKRQAMELIEHEWKSDPRAPRTAITERVLIRLEDARQDLGEAIGRCAREEVVRGLVGEFVRRTRAKIKKDILNGQETEEGLGGLPPYGEVQGVKITVPLGGGEYDTIPAELCTREEVRAARRYYAQQSASAAQRADYLAAIEESEGWDGLPEGALVRDLYGPRKETDEGNTATQG